MDRYVVLCRSLSRCLMVVVAIVATMLLLNGCISSGAPSTDIAAEDLLLTQEQVPATWERTQVAPLSIGRFGFGNEEYDRWVGFMRPDDPEERVFSNHFVLGFRNQAEARQWYERYYRQQFNSESIALDRGWQSHPDLTYLPTTPVQYRAACSINNIAGGRLVCKYMAQYDEFIVIFTSVIDADTTSIAGFNDLVEEIDTIMATRLQSP